MAVEFWEDSDLSPLEALLTVLQGSTPGQKLLEMKVDADEELVEGDDAYTWIQLSAEKPGCLAWCMKDDDGELS